MRGGLRSRMISALLPVALAILALATAAFLALGAEAQRERSIDIAVQAARRFAGEFDARLAARLTMPRTMARFLEANRSRDRAEVMDALRLLLLSDPSLIGTEVGYEPDAFDGRDAMYRGTPDHDDTGRFLPYWNRLGGTERLDPMIGMDESDWYLIPKRTLRESIIEPFVYEGVLMTSVMVPIVRDGGFVGIAGIDVSLAQLHREASALRLFDTGYVVISSATGRLISYPDESRIGTATLADVGLVPAAAGPAPEPGGAARGLDPVSGKDAIFCRAPIRTAGWDLTVVAPTDELFAGAGRLAAAMAGIALAAAAALSVALALAAGSIARPVAVFAAAAGRMAGGDLEARVPQGQGGEIGRLAEAFNEMGARLGQAFAEVRASVAELSAARAAQERLIAELEERNTELERFTYAVSHDLKNPLITIRGFLGYVERAAEDGDKERLRSDLSRIAKAAERMGLLLDDLLELSRIGRVTRPPETIGFGDLARDAAAAVSWRLEAGKVAIAIEEGLPRVYGDRERLREILENLIDNAAKACSGKEGARVEIGAESGPEGPVFYVRDNGRGIDPRYLERVFGLFERLDQSGEGTGLGLAIVRRIVEVHGGSVWAESAGLGEGATVKFTLGGERARNEEA